MSSLKRLLKGNERFVENVFNRNPTVFGALKQEQKPYAMWFSCCDSRIIPELVTSALPGSYYTKRNHANTVPTNDFATGAVLEYALEHLKVRTLVVCGHYDCGGVKGLFEERKGSLAVMTKFLEKPLNAVKKSLANRRMKASKEDFFRLVVEANILSQIMNMEKYDSVQKALDNGVEIIGLVYDTQTGRLLSGYPMLSKLRLLEDVKNNLK